MMHPQPEDAGQPETEPAGKRRCDNPQEVVKHGDRLGYHHPKCPDKQGYDKPGDGRQLRPPDSVLCVAKDACEEVLRCNMCIDDGSDGNGGDSNSPDDFADRDAPSCR